MNNDLDGIKSRQPYMPKPAKSGPLYADIAILAGIGIAAYAVMAYGIPAIFRLIVWIAAMVAHI